MFYSFSGFPSVSSVSSDSSSSSGAWTISTALKILAGKLKPNLGRFDDQPEWTEILQYFRGSELQNYFTKILEDK